MSVAFLDLGAIHASLQAELNAAATRVVESGWYVLGPEVETFEERFAAYIGVRHCVGVACGLDALHLALKAMEVGPGDEVIVPSNTYIATWLAVSQVGAVPVAVDPDPLTFNLDLELVSAAITPRTKALLPVHLYGQPVDMTRLRETAREHGLLILEDAAQAHGAAWSGQRAGSLGNAAAWSFYPSKNLGALGDAGAITTDDDEIAQRVRILRNYGARTKYRNEVVGVNSRLDELQAALLSVKLGRLDQWNARRAEIAGRYSAALCDAELILPTTHPDASHAWHLFVVRCLARERWQEHLHSAGIETAVHYPRAPYRQRAYETAPWRRHTTERSDELQDQVLSLPMGPHLSDDDVDETIDAVLAFASAGQPQRR